MAFKKAVRKGVWIKVALIGPSGSGKTLGALLLAKGIGEKTAYIDTENGRSLYYADRYDFDVMQLLPPYSPERFVDAMRDAYKTGYKTLVIDSASHEWMGKGGCLEIHDSMSGNSWQNWAKVTPRHQAFVDAIAQSPLHVIVCLRGKDEYVVEENAKGKSAPRKVGVGPQMRDGLEYECTLALLIDQQSHTCAVTKDNTGMFDGAMHILKEEHGQQLAEWAGNGGTAQGDWVTPAIQRQTSPQQTPAPEPAPPPPEPPAEPARKAEDVKEYTINGAKYSFVFRGPCSACGIEKDDRGRKKRINTEDGRCYDCTKAGTAPRQDAGAEPQQTNDEPPPEAYDDDLPF